MSGDDMYIYQTGMIGEAVRTKIENTKNSIQYGTENTQTFSDILTSMMKADSTQKVVGVSNNNKDNTNPVARADGSTLLYAIQNASDDTTASAVVNALGLTVSDNSLKTTADSLVSSLNLLLSINGTDNASALTQLTDFTEKFNTLLTDLQSSTTSAGFMYANILKTAAQQGADSLAKAGITVSDSGKLTLDSEKFESVGLEGFLQTASSAATAISSYASSIKPTGTGVLDFLTDNSDSDDSGFLSTSDYYNSLLNMYM